LLRYICNQQFFPYIKEKTDINTVIPLAESIIVGQVPENYINFYGLNEALKNGPQGQQK
jgi:hypothetical protein